MRGLCGRIFPETQGALAIDVCPSKLESNKRRLSWSKCGPNSTNLAPAPWNGFDQTGESTAFSFSANGWVSVPGGPQGHSGRSAVRGAVCRPSGRSLSGVSPCRRSCSSACASSALALHRVVLEAAAQRFRADRACRWSGLAVRRPPSSLWGDRRPASRALSLFGTPPLFATVRPRLGVSPLMSTPRLAVSFSSLRPYLRSARFSLAPLGQLLIGSGEILVGIDPFWTFTGYILAHFCEHLDRVRRQLRTSNLCGHLLGDLVLNLAGQIWAMSVEFGMMLANS